MGATATPTTVAEPAVSASGTTALSADRVREMLRRGDCVVVDVREADEHAREHIEGTTLMPLSRFDAATLPKGGTLVFQCRSGTRSQEAAQRALAGGCAGVCYLEGGLNAWRQAGLPIVEDRRLPISIMRQVQITAGSLVVVGTLLGALVNPWFLLLSGFVGAGLAFAGLSGTCGLALVLGKMPWNKAFAGTGCRGGSCGT